MKTKARVWNAAKFTPPQNAQIVLDTNIWLFMQMEEATQGFTKNNLAEKYMDVIDAILSAGGSLRWSGFSYPEVANVIEAYYCELHAQNAGKKPSKKRYRHESPQERLKVVTKVQDVWKCIKESGTPLDPFGIDANQVDDSIIDYRNYAVDPYDLFMVSSLKQDHLSYLLTDDIDFISVADIDVITLNQKTLAEAAQNNLLMNDL